MKERAFFSSRKFQCGFRRLDAIRPEDEDPRLEGVNRIELQASFLSDYDVKCVYLLAESNFDYQRALTSIIFSARFVARERNHRVKGVVLLGKHSPLSPFST